MRILSDCIPAELRELESPRSKETDEQARERGMKFWRSVYARNPAFDPEASVRASPDYAFIVRGKKILFLRKTQNLYASHVLIGSRSALRENFLVRWSLG